MRSCVSRREESLRARQPCFVPFLDEPRPPGSPGARITAAGRRTRCTLCDRGADARGGLPTVLAGGGEEARWSLAVRGHRRPPFAVQGALKVRGRTRTSRQIGAGSRWLLEDASRDARPARREVARYT